MPGVGIVSKGAWGTKIPQAPDTGCNSYHPCYPVDYPYYPVEYPYYPVEYPYYPVGYPDTGCNPYAVCCPLALICVSIALGIDAVISSECGSWGLRCFFGCLAGLHEGGWIVWSSFAWP